MPARAEAISLLGQERGIVVRVAAAEAGLEMLDASWDALARRQPCPNPALSATWLRELAKWEPGVPLIVRVEAEGRLVTAGAFGLRRPAGRLGPMLATWLGDERQWFSPDLLVDPNYADCGSSVVDAVLGAADAIQLSAAADGSMARALRDCVPWVHTAPRTSGWVVPIPPPRLEYAKRRVQYVQRRAERRGARVAVVVAEEAEEVRAALERLFVIHRERWDGRPGEIARFSTTERHRDWYRGLVSLLAARNEVRVCEVSEDGTVVASTLLFLCDRGSAFHTTAIRPANALLRGGHVALLACVEAAASAGAEVMDLGWGACAPESPKARFGPTPVPVARLRAASSPRRQRLFDGLDTAAGALERLRSRKPLSWLGRR
ncbi:MAG: Acetyltransferase domain [Actinomycetia bacterium]|nr:Acetyltransferase domain [Actinomycetes bacterium]